MVIRPRRPSPFRTSLSPLLADKALLSPWFSCASVLSWFEAQSGQDGAHYATSSGRCLYLVA